MKNLLLLVCLLFTTTAFAQTPNGGGKVKKVKTTKSAIVVKGGMASFSVENWKSDPSLFVQAHWGLNGLFKPRNPESHWGYEIGVGFDYYGGSAHYEGEKRTTGDENILMLGLFDIQFNVRYILNPLSTRGKWMLKGGADICPLEVGVPTEEYSSKSSYTHLKTGGVGTKLNLDASFGYEAKHWGIFAGGFAGIMTPYSSDESSSGVPTNYGYYASLQYYF